MIVTLYRKVVSPNLRERIYNLFLSDCIWFLRTMDPRLKGKFAYYFKRFLAKNEINEAYSFIGKYGVTDYPFEASLKYQTLKVNVLFDKDTDLLYINHNGRKLYFPRCYTTKRIIAL